MFMRSFIRGVAFAAALTGMPAAWAQAPALQPPTETAPKAPVAETEMQKVLKAGGVRLTGAQTRALQVGKTYYFKARSGKIGAFYTAADGRYATAIVGGPVFYGSWKIVGDAFVYSTDPKFTSPNSTYTVKGTEGIYGHFRVKDGLYTDSVVEFKPGNAEKFTLPTTKK